MTINIQLGIKFGYLFPGSKRKKILLIAKSNNSIYRNLLHSYVTYTTLITLPYIPILLRQPALV